MRTFDEIASAYSDGELLGANVKVGAKVTERFNDPEHLIIEVLPVITA